jgi:2-polyprenyl-6-methoxyphenol hydroxylase-like FAD-dependent oxidoreductase
VRILVIGAGIGGLAFANAAAQRGATLRIVERASRIVPLGAGIVLHPNGIRALDALEAGVAARNAGALIRDQVTHQPGARMRVAWRDVWGPDLPFTYGIERTKLAEILLDALPSGVELLLGLAAESARESPSGALVRFSDGSEETADLVVAADGVQSAICRALGLAGPRPLGMWYWRFPTAWRPHPLDEWHVFPAMGPNGVVAEYGFIPIGGDRAHTFLQVASDESPGGATIESATEWLEQWAGVHSTDLARAWAERTGPLHYGPAWEIAEHRWCTGHFALLGDCAHALAPTLSEGGSLSIEDGIVLAEELSIGGDIVGSLSRYAARRAPRLRWARRMATMQVRSFRSRNLRPTTLQHPIDADVAEFLRQVYGPLRTAP